MSNHEWKVVYRTIARMNRTIPTMGRKCQFPDSLIVAMYFWSFAHDRPRCWTAMYNLARTHGAVMLTPLPKNAGGGRRAQSPMRLLATHRHRSSLRTGCGRIRPERHRRDA